MELDVTMTTPMVASARAASSNGRSKLPCGPCRRCACFLPKPNMSSAHLQRGEANEHQHDADDPETDDDAGFRPALQFEMVVDRGHAEDPLAAQLETAHLQHH